MIDPLKRGEAFSAIAMEREYQEGKWPGHVHSPAEWLLILEQLIEQAKVDYYEGVGSIMGSVRKIAATAVAAMEQQGVVHR